MPPQEFGEWSQPRQTGQRIIGEEVAENYGGYGGYGGTGGNTGNGNTGGYSGGYNNYGASGSSPSKTFNQSHIDVTEESRIDPDVMRQLESGLIDANDIVEEVGELEDSPRQTFRRKVKKMVEVPVVRKVKVPQTTQHIVPVTETKTIQVKKTVPVTDSKWVDEAYTEIEERDATRMKEVWTKKMVPEQYKKKVEVRKTRRVQVPVTSYKEVTEDKVVEVETNKVEDVPGWRLDEIKDTKMVEIEGWQEVELVPRLKDTNIRIEKTYEREAPRRRVERRIGTNILVEEEDARLDQVDTDSSGDEKAEVTSVGTIKLDGTERRTKVSRRVRGAPRSHRFLTSSNTPAPPAVTSPAKSASLMHTPAPPASPNRNNNLNTSIEEQPTTPRGGNKMFGLRMNSKKEGLFVSEVAPGGFAQDAGLKSGDTIISVDGSNICSVKAWRSMLSQKETGEFLTMVVKDGAGKTRPVAIQLDQFCPEHYL